MPTAKMIFANLYFSLALCVFVARSSSLPQTPASHMLHPVSKVHRLDIVDLSPRVTANQTFYLSRGYSFEENATIYDEEGNAIYTVHPVPKVHSISLQKAINGTPVTTIQLANCTSSKKYPAYFLDSKTHQWQIQNEDHKLSDFDPVYQKASTGRMPSGSILLPNTGNYTLATISVDSRHPKKQVPGGKFYSLHIPADQGHDPFIQPEDALTLLFLLLNHGKRCASPKI